MLFHMLASFCYNPHLVFLLKGTPHGLGIPFKHWQGQNCMEKFVLDKSVLLLRMWSFLRKFARESLLISKCKVLAFKMWPVFLGCELFLVELFLSDISCLFSTALHVDDD